MESFRALAFKVCDWIFGRLIMRNVFKATLGMVVNIQSLIVLMMFATNMDSVPLMTMVMQRASVIQVFGANHSRLKVSTLRLPSLGYSGEYCNINDAACQSYDCGAQGECVISASGPICDCPLGFSGAGCTKQTDKNFDIELAEGATMRSVIPFEGDCSSWTLGFWVQTPSTSDGFISLYSVE
jgi:hypothetical protein